MTLRRAKWETCVHPSLLLYQGLNGSADRASETLAKEFTDAANFSYASVAWKPLLPAIALRQRAQLVQAESQGWQIASMDLRVRWRLLAGSSYGRIWGMSIQLHPLYGVPYLPASGIKGALRHWAEESGEAGKWVEEAFGSLDAAGRLMLLDAYPVTGGTLLQEDILNKHHKSWFEEKKLSPPASSETPEPVKFTTLRKGVVLRLNFAIRPTEELKVDTVRKHIVSCVKEAGLGAKTRKGYGRLRQEGGA